jgi:putative membrane protein
MLPVSFLRSWSLPPFATFALGLSAIFYLRGWWIVRSADQALLPSWRAGAFLSGLGFVWIALASPLDALNELLLTAHMLQHMLLMMVAPPLILLGAPLIPMVRGLPGVVVRRSIGSFLNWPVAERIGHALANPIAGALAMGLAMFAWHTPSLYELALRSESWHEVEHATFFLASLIFWWPVVLPWPSRGQWPRWAMVPYLLVADLQNTALSAILAFSDRVLYRSYSEAPRLSGLSALEDQVAAGAFMWLVGSMAFIVPAIGVAVQCLSTRSARDPVSAVMGAESTIRS